ncbi:MULTISPECIES: AAA family ATPase [unclassified Brevundimonas]|uniref:AAA family ATPase n=1 Tax=unclassified Brevundimonas TaxID=2622653 RepID=UPI00249E8DC3|nr:MULTISPECIES: AAA family ATPase [unclassified Brevundimonas]
MTELDGFDPSEGIVLLAATNRPEILDPALLRAGRFDRQMLVDRPDKTGRVQILNVHMKKVTLAPDVDAEKVAALTPGSSGADLANLVNEAALLATRRKADAVTMDDFNNAVERIIAGLEKKNRVLNPREREIVAHHEMGHALVAMALPGVDPVHKVSIIPRGIGALGYTIQRPTEDRFLMTREELETKIAVLLGGRAAEKIIYDHVSTGAADDLVKATDIARAMVARYGMDEDLGHVSYDTDRPGFLGTGDQSSWLNRRYSDATAERMDAKVRDIVDGVFKRTLTFLETNLDLLEQSAQDLLQRATGRCVTLSLAPDWIMKAEKTNGKRSLRYLRSPGDGACARLGERQGSEHGALRPALQRNGAPVGAQRLATGVPVRTAFPS